MKRVLLICICAVFLAHPALAKQQTYVLVHGAHVGAWYWKPVVLGLRERGHRVVAVDLTGHGTRASENSADVTLEQHIDDVVEAIRSTGERVVLVSHSYGGRPATGAWDRARDSIAAVIFLEAMSPYGTGENALQFDHIRKFFF